MTGTTKNLERTGQKKAINLKLSCRLLVKREQLIFWLDKSIKCIRVIEMNFFFSPHDDYSFRPVGGEMESVDR